LTGIRILAALAVYASHIGPPAGAPTFVSSFFTSGYCGVTLFFVLSGFVLAINYFDGFRRANAGRTYNYFVARIARVYPLYLLLTFYFVVRLHASGESIDGWWHNALAIQAWDPDVNRAFSFDPPSWSISVEFFLYACFPLLVPLLARLRRPRSTLLTAAAIAAGLAALAAWFVLIGQPYDPADPNSSHRWLYRMPLTRLGDFTLGILAARLYVQTRGRESVARAGLPLILGAAAVTVALMSWQGLVFTPWSWDVAYAVPATIFIFGLAVAPSSWPARLLSLPSMILLGEASYAFYLIHAPAISLLGAGQWAAGVSGTIVILEALLLGAIIAMAIGLHVAFERPARVYIRRLFSSKRRSAQVPSRGAAEPVPP
jgi:peptidoglycan/LPS O-acetylase OafA/YrhL